jgi:hypothetical protein
MEFEFRPRQLTEAEISRMHSAVGKDQPIATDVLNGRVKFGECVHDGRVVGHCLGNSVTGEILGLSVNRSYRRFSLVQGLFRLPTESYRGSYCLVL